MPYRDATQSGVIPLAYIFGKPVVATNVGGISEQLQDGIQGFLVSPEDEKAFASAVIRILKDDNIRKKMGENALAYYHNQLSGNRISRMTLETYEKALVSDGVALSEGSL